MKYISNFTGPEEVARFRVTGARAQWVKNTEEGALVEGVAYDKEASLSGAMHLRLAPGKTFTMVSYSAADGMPGDWRGYETLQLNYENASEFMINLHLTIADAGGAEYFADNLWISRGRNFSNIPLSEIRTREGRQLELGGITKLRLEIRSAEKFPRDVWLFQFRLLSAAEPIVEATRRKMLFDFGSLGSPVFPGARLVTDKTPYAQWRGYGWTTPLEGLTGDYFRMPDSLTNHWVWADLGDSPATFRADLPDGKYRARFYGGNYSSKVLPLASFALAVNGRKVASKSVTFDEYYSAEGHFFGINEWFSPDEDTYAKYVAPFWQTYDFEFEAKGGAAEFTWKGTLAAFGLLITPLGEFDAAARAVEDARRRSFAAEISLPEAPKRPIAVSPAEKKRGFVLWRRGWEGWDGYDNGVGIYDAPKKGERNPRALRFVAAKGQREHSTVTVTPLGAIGKVRAQVSDLKGPKGAKLAARTVEIRVVKVIWNGRHPRPEPAVLWPTDTAPSFERGNITFWLTAKPPKTAAAGVYRGQFAISAGKGGKAVVPIVIEVRPFALVDDVDVAYQFFAASDYNLNYSLRHWMPEHLDYLRRMIGAEIADMKEHGGNSLMFSPPIITGVEGERVRLDFTVVDEEIRAAGKRGFCTERHPGIINTLPDIARCLMPETRYGDFQEPTDMSAPLPLYELQEEFSPLFVARFVDICRQIHERFKKAGLVVCLYPVDEPREHNINRWNRNLADTIRYCKIIREHIPDALIWVDPMRHEGEGVDYVPICDWVDIIATHPWDQSERINQRVARDGKPILHYFNSILADRYDYGYAVAAANSKGFLQWCYSWDLTPFQPFHPEGKSGVVIKGPKGPIARPFYEVFATATDDYRYIATLRGHIEKARAKGRAAKETTAAEKTLRALLSKTAPYPVRKDYEGGRGKPRRKIAGKTLDEWRGALSKHIEAIDRAMRK